jgi:hypothetical protein
MYASTHWRWPGSRQQSYVQLSLRRGEASAERRLQLQLCSQFAALDTTVISLDPDFRPRRASPALDGTLNRLHRPIDSVVFAMRAAAMLGLCYSENARAASRGPQRRFSRCRWGGSRRVIRRPYPARKRAGSTTGPEVSAMRFIGRIVDHSRWGYPRNYSAPIISGYAGRNHAHS